MRLSVQQQGYYIYANIVCVISVSTLTVFRTPLVVIGWRRLLLTLYIPDTYKDN